MSEIDKVGGWFSGLGQWLRRRRLRAEQLKDVGVQVVGPTDFRSSSDGDGEGLGRAYAHGAIQHFEFTRCVSLGIPSPRNISKDRLPRSNFRDSVARRLRPWKEGTAKSADRRLNLEIRGPSGSGLTTALAQIVCAEATYRNVLFIRWPEFKPHLASASAEDELHALVHRRSFTLRPFGWRRPLVVVDDCPSRTFSVEPDADFLRFKDSLDSRNQPFVLGVKLQDANSTTDQIGYLPSECRKLLKVKRGEAKPIVSRWLDLVESPGDRSGPRVDRDRLQGWLNDRYRVHNGRLSVMLWMASQFAGASVAGDLKKQSNDALQRFQTPARTLIEAYCIAASVWPDAANRLFTGPDSPAAEPIRDWHTAIDEIASSDSAQSPTLRTLASFEIASGCVMSGSAPQALDETIATLGVDAHNAADWRLVIRGLIIGLSPSTSGLDQRERSAFRSRIRDVTTKHDVLNPTRFGTGPTEQIAIAATSRALGDRSSAAKIYRELLQESPWITDVERPEWFWPTLMIGLKETDPDSFANDECRTVALKCLEVCEKVGLPAKMSLGLSRSISMYVERGIVPDDALSGRLLGFSESLARRTLRDPGTSRAGAHSTARLVGGLSGPYEWQGSTRPDLDEAVEWASMAFESELPARDDPRAMRWQDVVTHDLLGSIFRAEYERRGSLGPEADHHYRLSLEALPREDMASVRMERQLNHLVRSGTGYALWWHRRGDEATAEYWYDYVVSTIEGLPDPPRFGDMGLAYLYRDIFWERCSRGVDQRMQGLSDALKRVPPSKVHQTLQSRYDSLQRGASGKRRA